MDISNLYFLDTETTGSGPDDRLCQLAWKQHSSVSTDTFSALYLPPVAISIEAMSVHHITTNMVANRPFFQDSADYQPTRELLEKEESVMVAHNAPFDLAMLKREGIEPTFSIDTLKLVRHFDPMMKMAKHNLQYLRYFLKLDDAIDVPITAHDALSDVIICELLFDRLYAKTQQAYELAGEEETLQRMIDISNQPLFIQTFNFGKHKGRLVEEVARTDRGYLEWLYQQKVQAGDAEDDWMFTLRKVLQIPA